MRVLDENGAANRENVSPALFGKLFFFFAGIHVMQKFVSHLPEGNPRCWDMIAVTGLDSLLSPRGAVFLYFSFISRK